MVKMKKFGLVLPIILFVLLSFSLICSVAASSDIWSQTYGGGARDSAEEIVQTSDGGYAVAGWTVSLVDNVDCLLIKTDAFGNMVWNQTYGEEGMVYASSLVMTSDGGFALAGETFSEDGLFDFSLVKTDEDGDLEWTKTYGGEKWDRASSLVSTSDSGFALAGETKSFGVGEYDFWLVRIDGTGNIVWNQTYGGTENDRANALVETSDGGFALAGRTKSFGAGEYDFWLVKTDEFGNIPEFSSWIILPLLLTVTLLIIFCKRRLAKTTNN